VGRRPRLAGRTVAPAGASSMLRSRSRLLAGAAAERAQGLIVRGADTAQRDLSGWPAAGFAKALDQREDAGRLPGHHRRP
jgi:hypothetical protein